VGEPLGRPDRRSMPAPVTPPANPVRPTLPPGLNAPSRFWEKSPVASPVAAPKEEIPAMDEIDGILDGLVGEDS